MEASARLAAAACFASADSKRLLARAGATASSGPLRDGPSSSSSSFKSQSADSSFGLGVGCAGREKCQKEEKVLQSKGQWDLIV